jgi:CheY-like chemotaxis protein
VTGIVLAKIRVFPNHHKLYSCRLQRFPYLPLGMAKTILLVDDDQDDIDLLREAIETINKDIKVITANNCKDALELCLGEEPTPDEIFLDINMPAMNGIDCLEELNRQKKIPPLVVTIYTTSDNRFKGYDRCMALGAGYLQKPNSYGELIEILKNKIPHRTVL